VTLSPSIARASRQLSLLDVQPRFTITKNAQARNAYGTIAADIVCKVLGLDPIPINGKCTICFDAERSNHFFEIKSVKASNKVVIYDWRMEKERLAKVPLSYAILCHNVRCSSGKNLLDEMLESRLELLVLPASEVHALATASPLHKILTLALDPRNGYTRPGYRDGYRNVPVSDLRKLCPFSRQEDHWIYGQQFRLTISRSEEAS
jgi:hypothetical protein